MKKDKTNFTHKCDFFIASSTISKMLEFVKDYFNFSPSKNTVVSRFDYLDGFRGFLAILVVFQHSQSDFELQDDYRLFISIGNFIGVSGFFALSSFLLTYRLLKDFDKAKTAREECLIILKYAIKRFFRIYLTFFVYVTFIQIDPKFFGGKFNFSSWYSLVTLQRSVSKYLMHSFFLIRFDEFKFKCWTFSFMDNSNRSEILFCTSVYRLYSNSCQRALAFLLDFLSICSLSQYSLLQGDEQRDRLW